MVQYKFEIFQNLTIPVTSQGSPGTQIVLKGPNINNLIFGPFDNFGSLGTPVASTVGSNFESLDGVIALFLMLKLV